MDSSRTSILIGAQALEKLKQAQVHVFGTGGVGGYAVEALARAGVGSIRIYDFDTVSPSNCNRQLIALDSTIGRAKAEAAAERVRDINADCRCEAVNIRLTRENVPEIIAEAAADANGKTLWAIDAIDEISAKARLICELKNGRADFISSMGAGNRLDPARVEIADISQTSVCPLARKLRRALRACGIAEGVPCVFSAEEPRCAERPAGCTAPGSISYMPGLFGLMAAGYIIKRITA